MIYNLHYYRLADRFHCVDGHVGSVIKSFNRKVFDAQFLLKYHQYAHTQLDTRKQI